MAEKITSFDVARRAGVSRTTVSMVLNRSEAVSLSEETRKRVLQAAADLGYRPNSAARMLVRGDTETIGLVISDASILPIDGFIPSLLSGIGEVNQQHGYHVLLEGLTSSTLNPYESLVETRRIDGLIVLNPKSHDPALLDLIERGFPVVLVGSLRHPEECSVSFSSSASIAEAVRHLVDLGHRHFGTVTFSPKGYVATDGRIASLRRALKDHGCDLPEDAIDYGNFSADSGSVATGRLLDRRPQVTALFAGNDTIAIGAISEAVRRGLSVPRDLSIVGFDNLPVSAFLNPALSTIGVDAVEQGRIAARMLIDLLRGEKVEPRQVRMPSRFIRRSSTGQARR